MGKSINNVIFSGLCAFCLLLSVLCNSVYGQEVNFSCEDNICVGDVVLDSAEAITEEIEQATVIVGNLIIRDADQGTDIRNSDLARLQVRIITRKLAIHRTKLRELNAFNSLLAVGGGLDIGSLIEGEGNPRLRSVSGFDNLSTLGGLLIGENNALTTVTGFEELDSIARGMIIRFNAVLSSLPDFSALRTIGEGFPLGEKHSTPITIGRNPLLATCCEVLPFMQEELSDRYRLGGNGTPDIRFNAEGCSSVEEVRETCLVMLSTNPADLVGLAKEEGQVTVDIALLEGVGSWAASTDADFITLSETSGTGAGSFTISYAENEAAAFREGIVTITSTGGIVGSISRDIRLVQLGTAPAIVGDVLLDSAEAITEEIEAARYIFGDLVISDGDEGDDISNNDLAALQVQRISGSLTMQATKLRELNAFNSLTSVGVNLSIGGRDDAEGNAMLGSISGFDALERVGGLLMGNNSTLTSVSGFGVLQTVGIGGFLIGENGLTSLSGFGELQTVGNDFVVAAHASLESVSGFGALQTVERDWGIARNASLESISGFGALQTVGRDLLIFGRDRSGSRQDELESIPVFGSLQTIGGDLQIAGLAALRSISGFAALRTIGGGMQISGLAALRSVSGFGMLQTMEGRLAISENLLLTSLPDFNSLPSLKGLSIIYNARLASLPGFASLVSLGDSLVVRNNFELVSLSSFPALRSIGSEIVVDQVSRFFDFPIRIIDNPLLSTCCGILPFSQNPLHSDYTLGGNRRLVIRGNAEGCSLVANIESACLPAFLSTSPTDLIGLARAAGELTVAIELRRGNTNWSASTTAGFITFSSSSGAGDGSLRISYGENTDVDPREAIVQITATGGTHDPIPLAIRIVQLGTLPVIIDDIVLNSAEDITDDIREARRIVGNLTIGDGDEGTDLSNADLQRLSLEEITGSLKINRTKLRELNAFNSLRSIGDSLDIGGIDEETDGNRMLLSMSGFDVLDSIGGRLYMKKNDELTTITAFGSLSSVGGQLEIVFNDALTTITAFGRLDSVGRSLEVSFNAALSSLPDFSALRSVGGAIPGRDEDDSPIVIRSNVMLSVCCGLFPFAQEELPDGYTLGGNGSPSIEENARGCFSIEELQEACLLGVSTDPMDLLDLGSEAGEISVTIFVSGDVMGWEVSTTAGFITLSSPSGTGDGSFMISYSENTDLVARIGLVRIRATGESVMAEEIITLRQAGIAHVVSVSEATYMVTGLAGNIESTITISGAAEGWEAVSSDAFVTFGTDRTTTASSSESGALIINYTANEDAAARTATITIRTTGEGEAAEATITLTQQAQDQRPRGDLAALLGVISQDGSVVLYPNPVSGRLYIGGLRGSAVVGISTLGGVIVRRTVVSPSNSSVDVRDLRGGTYVAVIESSEGLLSKRLVLIE